MKYIPRSLETILKEMCRQFKAILVTGPRQVGKTTMLKKCLGGSCEYVTPDDMNDLDMAKMILPFFQESQASGPQNHPEPDIRSGGTDGKKLPGTENSTGHYHRSRLHSVYGGKNDCCFRKTVHSARRIHLILLQKQSVTDAAGKETASPHFREMQFTTLFRVQTYQTHAVAGNVRNEAKIVAFRHFMAERHIVFVIGFRNRKPVDIIGRFCRQRLKFSAAARYIRTSRSRNNIPTFGTYVKFYPFHISSVCAVFIQAAVKNTFRTHTKYGGKACHQGNVRAAFTPFPFRNSPVAHIKLLRKFQLSYFFFRPE
jgi:hypothetical protein